MSNFFLSPKILPNPLSKGEKTGSHLPNGGTKQRQIPPNPLPKVETPTFREGGQRGIFFNMAGFATLPQRGAILIIVLWFIVIVTVMVAALATETRLSAKAVFYNKMGMQTWNDTLHALNAAQRELAINRMPDPPGEEKEIPLGERKNKKYRFDGRVLDLADDLPDFPIPDTVQARIYDHAGKINLLRLSNNRRKMRDLLKKRIGDDPEKLDPLLDAWKDWIDKNDLKHANGAEKDYYEKLDPPYEPRNAPLETVEELLLIKGFAEVFEGVEITAAFTVFSERGPKVDPNLATREALMLIPGLDEGLVNTILTQRREKEFKSNRDFNELVEPEQLAKFRSWMDFSYRRMKQSLHRKYCCYTIAVQVKPPEEIDKSETEEEAANTEALNEQEETATQPQEENQRAYMITVKYRDPRKFLPLILMVNPYGVLPDTRHLLMSSDEDENGSDEEQSTFPSPFK
jgi:general secretion pathway protein K